jgi:hypothetical protein
MKVTKNYIKQLVKEELEKTLDESRNTAIFEIEPQEYSPTIRITDGAGKKYNKTEDFVEAYPESAGRIRALTTRVTDMVSDSLGKMGSETDMKMRRDEIERFVQAIARFDLNVSDYDIRYLR